MEGVGQGMSTISSLDFQVNIERLSQCVEALGSPLPVRDLRERISCLEQIPPLPAITQEILTLYSNPHASTESLARIVEKDPALSAQVIRWANSAMYGRGESATVQDAIGRVLGFDLVMNLAVGLTAAAPLKVEDSGPIGLKAYWVDALFSAMLCQRLAKYCMGPNLPQPGVAYMAGLLHNLGLLLFAHLFPSEHKALNRILASAPDIPFPQLIEYSLGVSPVMLSRWLLDDWNLPEVLRLAISYQGDPTYHGIHAVYPRLVLIANAALRPHKLSGYVVRDLVTIELLAVLGLDPFHVTEEVQRLVECKQEVIQFAGQIYH
jgi:HD-like signal output (HDOD) protein